MLPLFGADGNRCIQLFWTILAAEAILAVNRRASGRAAAQNSIVVYDYGIQPSGIFAAARPGEGADGGRRTRSADRLGPRQHGLPDRLQGLVVLCAAGGAL